jgi:hypothetical protein
MVWKRHLKRLCPKITQQKQSKAKTNSGEVKPSKEGLKPMELNRWSKTKLRLQKIHYDLRNQRLNFGH